MRHARDKQAGVTLLEMLVALVVMAFLAAIGASVLSFSARSLARIGGSSKEAGIALARNDLRYWIEHALILSSGAGMGVDFDGSSQNLSFHSILDDGLFWPGQVTVVDFGLDSSGDGPRAVATASGVSDATQLDVKRLLTLSEQGARVSIGYFGRTTNAPYAEWHELWNSADGVPALVRITIDDTARTYPPVIVQPGRAFRQREMSLSSLLPPALPSRP